MGLLDLFWRAKKTDPVFGDLVYSRRAWNGQLFLPELCKHNIPLEIQTTKDSDLAKFRPVLACLRSNIREIRAQIADESLESYRWYVETDRELGNFTDADYAQHPTVTSTADIWNALQPFRLTMTDDEKYFNVIIWLDVDWPNPHYFVAYLKNADLYHLDVDG